MLKMMDLTRLSPTYMPAGGGRMYEDRHLMKKSGIKKRPGCSWVQGQKGTASFFVGDRSHPLSPQIYALLESLIDRIKAMGYVPRQTSHYMMLMRKRKIIFLLSTVRNLLLHMVSSQLSLVAQ